MSTTAPLQIRASLLKECPRLAVYDATGAPHRERTEREEKTLFRGRRVGQDWVVMFAHTNKLTVWVDSGPYHWVPADLRADSPATAGVIAELRVPWAGGTGHADAFVVETGSLIEVLSSQHASAEMIHSKLVQVVLYIEHHAAAKGGALVVVNPVDLDDELFPIAKSSPQYDELAGEMRDRIAQVQTWAEEAALPSRVCNKPSEARSHFCQYAAHCFEGWEAPPLEEVAASQETLEAVETLRNVKQERRVIGQRDKQLETQQKQTQELLDELPLGVCQVGRYEVKRTHVQRKPTFQWEKAELAGVFEAGLYGDYMKPGAGYDRWDVQAVAEEDYGEVPF